MTPLSLYTAIRSEEVRTGERVLPEWLKPHKYNGLFEQVDDDGTLYVSTDAASAILLGSMAAWCSGRGICVWWGFDTRRWWRFIRTITEKGTATLSDDATSALSAYGEATLAAMRAMETKGAQ